jgi:hypothetical protein
MYVTRMVVALGLAAVVSATGCSKGPSTKQCEELLGHLVDIEVAAGGGANAPAEQQKEIEKQKAALAEHVRKPFMEKCGKEVPKAFVECGLAAKDHDALAKCEKN